MLWAWVKIILTQHGWSILAVRPGDAQLDTHVSFDVAQFDGGVHVHLGRFCFVEEPSWPRGCVGLELKIRKVKAELLVKT